MMKASVYIATSLDGFIARANGALDWLPGGEGEDAGDEDYGYQEFMDSVDCLVMGRKTYELVLSFDPWPYPDTPVVVLSTQPLEIPAHLAGAVEWMSGSPHEVARRLAERGAKHLYIDGGKTIQGFLAEGLIQQLIITKIPVLIGNGIPLFGPLPHDIKLRHIETRTFVNGLVQCRYEVAG
jgi:dihydrofolate reductase